MPTGPLEAVPLIVDTVTAMNPGSVVDLGMGTGKYGFLIRERLDLAAGTHDLRLVGVEGFPDYIGPHQRAVYDEIVETDVISYLRSTGERFDVGLALDIIEHFAPADAVEFMRAALDRCRVVVVSTPRSFYAQDEHANALEHHRSWWARRDLQALATVLEADIRLRRLRLTHVAMLGRGPLPRFADERARAARKHLRDALIPEPLYCRLRRKTGPHLHQRFS